jgi:exodeoxyribonuclease V beta subunit
MFVEALRGYRDLEEVVYEIDRLEAVSPQSDLRGIRIMTVHKSKGLEFEHVIVLDQLGRGRSRNDPIVYDYEGATLKGLFYRIKDREWVDEAYARALEKEKKASEEDRMNTLYVALTRAVESLSILSKSRGSWFEPLELSPCERGEIEVSFSEPKPGELKTPPPYAGISFGRQEESLVAVREETRDYHAVQFGTALHFTLEVMGEFSFAALNAALESTRNRFGAILPPGAIEEIERRIGVLMSDPLFRTLSAGEQRREQTVRYQGGIHVIDLLVRQGEEWIVIDYKSGRDEGEKHRSQVRRYVEAVGALSGEKVQGYLCYLLADGVEWEKCL